MFNIRLLNHRKILNLQVIQHARTSSKDPGINLRKKALNATSSEFDFDDFDDLETDFMGLHKTHREHQEEMEAMKEKIKYHIVKQKYFKEKYPNFLTWNDKEQIKYLHTTDPDEWTLDRLSESFPALPDVIKKIIKGKYSKDDHKISAHDTAVQKNWTAFKKGKLKDLPPDLVQHLKKFTNRSANFKPIIPLKHQTEVVAAPKVSGEFSEIITSYEKLKKTKAEESVKTQVIGGESYVAHPDKDEATLKTDKKYQITLHELKHEVESKHIKGEQLSEDEKVLLVNRKELETKNELVDLTKEDLSSIIKIKSSKSLTKKSLKDYSHLIYPEKIVIPKDKLKRGCTYKLNDCYYDSYGSFLYRVPGME